MSSGLLFCLACMTLGSEPRYTASEVAPHGEFQDYWIAEVNGDDRADLLISTWSEDRDRELLVYHQDKSGSFSNTPSYKLSVKKDIVAFTLADVRPSPGAELLLFTRSACFSFSTSKKGYAGNVKRLFSWTLIATVPDRKKLFRLNPPQDLNSDGRDDLLLPGISRYAIFYRGDGENFSRRQVLLALESLSPRAFSFRRENRLIFTSNGPPRWVSRTSPFKELTREWNGGADSGGGSLLSIEHWIPNFVPARINDDKHHDLLFLSKDDKKGVLNVLYQKNEGVFSNTADFNVGIANGIRSLKLVDLNGDELLDLMGSESPENDESRVYFYKNKSGQFDLAKPDQVMKFAGYGVRPSVLDLDKDGRSELLVSFYSISTLAAVRDGTVVRTQLIYASDPTAVFEKRPSSKLEETFSARAFMGIGQRIEFRADIDGDRRFDALQIDTDGALAAKRINSRLRIDSESFWKFVPRRTIVEFEPHELNQDAYSDVVLRHIRSLTVLVSSGR